MAEEAKPAAPAGGRPFGWFFAALCVLLLLLFFRILEPFLIPLFWAALFALLLYPLHLGLQRRLRGHAWVSSLLLTVATGFLLVLPLVVIAILLGIEAFQVYTRVQTELQGMDAKQFLDRLGQLIPEGLLARLREEFGLKEFSVGTALIQGAGSATKFVAEQVRYGVTGLFAVLFDFAIMLFALFFFLRDGAVLYRGVFEAIPMPAARKERIFGGLKDALHATVLGMVATAAVQALLLGLSFWALGLPFPVLAGALTFIFAFFPMIGSAAVWVPIAVYLFAAGQAAKAVALILLGAVVVGSVDNVLRPFIIGRRTRLPTLFLFLTILGALPVFGFSGVVLGPALLAVMVGVIEIYRHELSGEGAGAARTVAGEHPG